MPVVIVQFDFTVVSGFLKGETHGGELRYDDAVLRGSGVENVPAESLCFYYRGDEIRELDSQPMLTFVDGVLDKLTMCGGRSSHRFSVNTGFKAQKFNKKSEAALRDGAQFFVYYDRNGFYAGAGAVSYQEVTVPALDGELIAMAATLVQGSREQAMKHLFSFLFSHTRLSGAIYDGVTYRELPNPWAHETGEHACTDCSSYGPDCPMRDIQRVLPAPGSTVGFVWEWDNESVEQDKYRLLSLLLERLMGGPDVLFLAGELVLRNNSGWNSDHRGSDHCMLVLPVQSQIVLRDPTLSQVVQALYALKSHKFDGWYEMYYACEIFQYEKITTVSLSFDHGS